MLKLIQSIFLIWVLTISIVGQESKIENLNCNFHIKNLLLTNDGAEWVGLFVKGNQSEVRQFCEKHNALYRGSVKGWHYIRVQLHSIPELINDKRFHSVDYSPYKGQPMNDTMRVNNIINPIHNGLQPLDASYKGSGVIVGFIDTGIDFRHQDFRTTNNRTRVLHLWDQTLSNNGFTPAAYGYGRNWDSTQINNTLANVHTDQWGHGSTVAGTAVSNGLATGTHQGVAPNSWIIAVESRFNALDWLSTVVDATEYIYTKADQHNMPCVINASLGTYLGSHDGLDPYSLYIDSLINAQSGRLFVASAGNGGQFEKYHIRNQVTPDTTFTWFKNNPSSGFGGSATFWELWADTADFNNINYGVHANTSWPNYQISSRTGFKNVAANLNTLLYDTLYNANGNRIATVQFWAQQRDGQYLVQVYMPQPDSANYLFGFETHGSGAFDVWSRAAFGMSAIVDTIQNISNFPFISKYVRPDSLQSIVSAFQCSEHVIAVGNYVNDSGYVNKFNNWIQTDQPRGKLALTSSLGPSRDGKIKPEVAASGHNTLSTFPLSLITTINNNPPQDTSLALGGMHRANGGTSMSSPVVAGIGALLLEKCPNMTMAEFKQLLINNTYSDGFTGTLPNVAFGYGKVNGFATLVASNYSVNYSGSLRYCETDSTHIVLDNYETYTWSTGNNTSSEYFSAPTSIAIQTSNEFGCKSDTLHLTIDEQQLPLISTLEDSLIYCDNSFSSATITGIFDSVIWSDVNADNPRIFNTPFNGFVQAIDSIGCLSDSLFIVVSEQLRPSILNTHGIHNFCENDSVNIDITGIFETVSWNDLNTNNPRTFYNSFSGSVVAIDSIGCISDTFEIEIFEKPLPTVNCQLGNYAFCEGDSVSINVTGTDLNEVIWNDLNTSNPRVFYTGFSGFVQAVDTLGCLSSICSINIDEHLLPNTPIIYHNFDTLFVASGEANYQWYLNGNLIQNGPTPYLITQENGSYLVEVTNTNNCVATSSIYSYQSTGIDENSGLMSVFPNPTTGLITINSLSSNLLIKVYDAKGSLLLTESTSSISTEIDLNEFENGIYFMHISTNDTTFVQKIMLNK
jgi:hypothetical protein